MKSQEEKIINYLTLSNNAKISFFTSQSNICPCTNILTENNKVIINI